MCVECDTFIQKDRIIELIFNWKLILMFWNELIYINVRKNYTGNYTEIKSIEIKVIFYQNLSSVSKRLSSSESAINR